MADRPQKYQHTFKMRLCSLALHILWSASIFSFFLAVIYIFSGKFNSVLFFGALGMFLRFIWKRNYSIKRLAYYLWLIVEEHIFSLEDLAIALELDYPTVVRDVKNLFKYGYFPGYALDEAARCIIPPDYVYEEDGVEVNCSSCGAPAIVLTNVKHTCEYCGTTTVFEVEVHKEEDAEQNPEECMADEVSVNDRNSTLR